MRVMTENTRTMRPVEPHHRPHRGVAAAVIGALDVAVVALLMLIDKVEVQAQEGLDQVAFGMPLNWVTQQQTLDPPLPYSANFISPWENPTAIEWLPLALNLLLVGVVLAGVWRLVLALRSSRSAK